MEYDMYTVPEVTPEARRSSLEEPADVKADEKKRKRPKPYRRSHSLAEIRRPTAIFIPEGIFLFLLLYTQNKDVDQGLGQRLDH